MENYIGVKMIKAEPCTAWKDTGEYKVGDAGYKVLYEDGYESWSPKEIFEKAYRKFNIDQNKITQKDVDGFITEVEVKQVRDNTVLVIVTLANGFTLSETSACVDPKNFSMDIGVECCMEKIKDKVWFLLGFLLQCANGMNKGVE